MPSQSSYEYRLVLTSPKLGREDVRLGTSEAEARKTAAYWKGRNDRGTIGHVERRSVTRWKRIPASSRPKAVKPKEGAPRNETSAVAPDRAVDYDIPWDRVDVGS